MVDLSGVSVDGTIAPGETITVHLSFEEGRFGGDPTSASFGVTPEDLSQCFGSVTRAEVRSGDTVSFNAQIPENFQGRLLAGWKPGDRFSCTGIIESPTGFLQARLIGTSGPDFSEDNVQLAECDTQPREFTLGDTMQTSATVANTNALDAHVTYRWRIGLGASGSQFIPTEGTDTVVIAGNSTERVTGSLDIDSQVLFNLETSISEARDLGGVTFRFDFVIDDVTTATAAAAGTDTTAEPQAARAIRCGDVTLVAGFDEGNVSVSDCSVSPTDITTEETATLSATISNANAQSASGTVVWEVFGQPVAQTEFSAAPNSSDTVSTTIQGSEVEGFAGEGTHDVEVDITGATSAEATATESRQRNFGLARVHQR